MEIDAEKKAEILAKARELRALGGAVRQQMLTVADFPKFFAELRKHGHEICFTWLDTAETFKKFEAEHAVTFTTRELFREILGVVDILEGVAAGKLDEVEGLTE